MSSPESVFSGMLRAPVSVSGKAGEIDWRVNVRVAIRSVVNVPVPRMLLISPRGVVATLGLSEKSSPSSVPASHGKRSTSCERSHWPEASSSNSPETPTNQSWLGAIIVVSVTRGNAVVSMRLLRVRVAVGPMELVLPSRTERAAGGSAFRAALTSPRRLDVPPISAIDSTPGLAVPPLSRKVTPALCTAPIRREKCAPPGRPSGVTAVVQWPRKRMV